MKVLLITDYYNLFQLIDPILYKKDDGLCWPGVNTGLFPPKNRHLVGKKL